jgi:hypothetical protein
MRRAVHAACAVLAVFFGGAARAQNTNPDISVIGDVRAFVTDYATDPREGDLQLDLTGAEVALQGYLNPFARADVYVGYHDDEFELEEAYATILRGLPGGLQLRAGKYRVDFGKLNLLHPHAYSFLDTPLVHQEFLGHEGLADVGFNANVQIPVGASALTISGNVLKGDFAEPHSHDHDGEEAVEEETVETDIGYSERVSIYIPTGDYAGFEAGVNALQGVLDATTNRGVELLGADLKYRWAPDKYRSLTVQGEWIRSQRDVAHHHEHEEGGVEEEHGEIERITGDGFFLFADYRFAQAWNAGAIIEQTDHAEEEGVTTRRFGAFAGFQVMEETTTVRLLLRRIDGDEIDEPYNEAILQLVFSLGPHKAHWF